MGAFVARLDREGWPPIRGVVHSAGIAEITPLLEVQPDDLDRQLRPKSVGAWVLHRLFADRPLDFFVLFGSASSILSSPFTAVYAAANANLDALAQLRRNQGKPCLTIGWGLWQDTGMAELKEGPAPAAGLDTGLIRAQVRLSGGMGALKPSHGVRVFHRLLRHDQAQVAAVPIDWSVWGRRYQEVSRSALLEQLMAGEGGAPTRRRRARLRLLISRTELLQLPAAERLSALGEHLHRGISATLGAESSDVRPNQPLVDLGFDSLMAVELRNEIEGQLGVFLPVSAFLADASAESLTHQVMDLLVASEGGSGIGGGGTGAAGSTITRVERFEDVATELLAQIDDLSEDQARRAACDEADDDRSR